MPKHIVLFGAGRSATRFIKYIQDLATEKKWTITIADRDEALVNRKAGGDKNTRAVVFNLDQTELLRNLIQSADLVVSMLPAHLHISIAKECLAAKKHMLTASYISKEMLELHEEALKNDLLFLNEMGVDPGIDHLSAMELLDRLRAQGATITGFESFTGGLPAPGTCDDNPWNYFFSWNPRNVVLAGAGGAVKFRQEGKYKYIPYHKLFRRTEIVQLPKLGRFEGYPNRDSLKYRSAYGLQDIPTIFRGTFRRPGFCRAWDVFVKLGMTDDSYEIVNDGSLTHREFVNLFLAFHPSDSVELKLMHYLNIPQDSDIMEKLEWLDLFSNDAIEMERATPAQILEYILMKKWTMRPEQRDMIVMFHKVIYNMPGENEKTIHSYMSYEGKSANDTAMSDTVGLPLGVAAELILDEVITRRGVVLPVMPDIYQPMLEKLRNYGVEFLEVEV
jgi:saccharopine dehydrogenase-like NADP-dependent oxidoreductase